MPVKTPEGSFQTGLCTVGKHAKVEVRESNPTKTTGPPELRYTDANLADKMQKVLALRKS